MSLSRSGNNEMKSTSAPVLSIFKQEKNKTKHASLPIESSSEEEMTPHTKRENLTISQEMSFAPVLLGLDENPYDSKQSSASFSINSSEFRHRQTKTNCASNCACVSCESIKKMGKSMGRFFVELTSDAAPVYLFAQIMPTFPAPHAMAMATMNFVINHRIGEGLNAVITKHDPLSGLRADGAGHLKDGVVKQSIKKGTTFITVMIAGYSMSCLVMKFGEQWKNYDQPSLPDFMKLLEQPAFVIPLFGLTGYGINKIGLAFWDCCWPKKNERLSNNKVNLLQMFGQYVMSGFGAFTLDTMLVWNLKEIGLTGGLVLDPKLVVVRVIGCYALRESLIFTSSSESRPRKKMKVTVDHPSIQESEDEATIIEPITPSYKQGVYHAAIRAGVNSLLLGLCYIIDNYGTCAHMPEVCEVATLENTVIRDGIALGGSLLTGYVIEKVVPRVYSWTCAFFANSAAVEANVEQPLLETDGKAIGLDYV